MIEWYDNQTQMIDEEILPEIMTSDSKFVLIVQYGRKGSNKPLLPNIIIDKAYKKYSQKNVQVHHSNDFFKSMEGYDREDNGRKLVNIIVVPQADSVFSLKISNPDFHKSMYIFEKLETGCNTEDYI